MAKRIAIKDLHAGSIDSTPINIEDWREVFAGHDGYTQTENTFWEAVTCYKCGKVVVMEGGGGNDQHFDVEDSKCDGYFPAAEGPMMNYWYPADLSDGYDAAELIAGMPLCVVRINGSFGLALTGGGMDLSWEICEAFTRLGELPPVHFCNLPRMAGRGTSAKDRYIISACRASLTVRMKRCKWALKDLRGVSK